MVKQPGSEPSIVIDSWNKMSCLTALNKNMSGFTCKQVKYHGLPVTHDIPPGVVRNLQRPVINGIREIDFVGMPAIHVTTKVTASVNIDYTFAGDRIECSRAGKNGLSCKKA